MTFFIALIEAQSSFHKNDILEQLPRHSKNHLFSFNICTHVLDNFRYHSTVTESLNKKEKGFFNQQS